MVKFGFSKRPCQTSKTRMCARLSPNQVLTHAARAAAEQLNFSHLWWPRAARAKGSDHARMARRAQHLRCYVREANERTTGWIRRALVRANLESSAKLFCLPS